MTSSVFCKLFLPTFRIIQLCWVCSSIISPNIVIINCVFLKGVLPEVKTKKPGAVSFFSRFGCMASWPGDPPLFSHGGHPCGHLAAWWFFETGGPTCRGYEFAKLQLEKPWLIVTCEIYIYIYIIYYIYIFISQTKLATFFFQTCKDLTRFFEWNLWWLSMSWENDISIVMSLF